MMKSCNEHDFFVEYQIYDKCPVCDLIDTIKELRIDRNDLMERVDYLESNIN